MFARIPALSLANGHLRPGPPPRSGPVARDTRGTAAGLFPPAAEETCFCAKNAISRRPLGMKSGKLGSLQAVAARSPQVTARHCHKRRSRGWGPDEQRPCAG